LGDPGNELAMNPIVGAEFWMESRYQMFSFFDHYRIALVFGENLGFGAYPADYRRADEHGFRRLAGDVDLGDAAVDLAAAPIPGRSAPRSLPRQTGGGLACAWGLSPEYPGFTPRTYLQG